MRTKDVKNYRGHELILKEWTTWNGRISEAWSWTPIREFREEMPWVPVSIPGPSLEEIKDKVDDYLDNVEKHRAYNQTIINATAEWCAKYGSE
jgi:hypothetical protein